MRFQHHPTPSPSLQLEKALAPFSIMEWNIEFDIRYSIFDIPHCSCFGRRERTPRLLIDSRLLSCHLPLQPSILYAAHLDPYTHAHMGYRWPQSDSEVVTALRQSNPQVRPKVLAHRIVDEKLVSQATLDQGMQIILNKINNTPKPAAIAAPPHPAAPPVPPAPAPPAAPSALMVVRSAQKNPAAEEFLQKATFRSILAEKKSSLDNIESDRLLRKLQSGELRLDDATLLRLGYLRTPDSVSPQAVPLAPVPTVVSAPPAPAPYTAARTSMSNHSSVMYHSLDDGDLDVLSSPTKKRAGPGTPTPSFPSSIVASNTNVLSPLFKRDGIFAFLVQGCHSSTKQFTWLLRLPPQSSVTFLEDTSKKAVTMTVKRQGADNAEKKYFNGGGANEKNFLSPFDIDDSRRWSCDVPLPENVDLTLGLPVPHVQPLLDGFIMVELSIPLKARTP